MEQNLHKLIQNCSTFSLWWETTELQESQAAMGYLHPNIPNADVLLRETVLKLLLWLWTESPKL